MIALKVLILGATFWFIFNRLSSLDRTAWETFSTALSGQNLTYILLFILVAGCNWLLEITKWRTIVSPIRKINFRESARHCLSALSASLWTPNRIGEYGVKALYFHKEERKKVMVLNLFSNLSQMFATLLFGIPGLLYFVFRYQIDIPAWKPLLILTIVLLLLVFGYAFRKKQLLIRGLTIQKLLKFITSISLEVRSRVVLLSLFRYIVFASLFYLLLVFFGIEIGLSQSIPLITAMYLIASVLPSFFFTEVAIKGGVALWLFSMAGYNEIPVLCTVTAMWLLNFVFPAVLGSFYVGQFKLAST
ncbi:flippase-like domain-containing protein [Aureitalea sp. L0-47]|uniref:flippase-like domain-containing protein n=1 Tax=Aureitalea sp. L0-47 TaxID=2816962 RepID=UPI0022381E42|nr:flippase-like domain-containing protein [Aureitalea sp. L0-47]MCW5518573.1 flippase-like domain-containing protein [Aureitalea sp. L0-47]